ncbi:uncharacterized protein LOC122967334, partial [Scomber scombrus]
IWRFSQSTSVIIRHHQTPSDTIRHHQTPSNTIRHHQIPSDTSNTISHHQTPSSTVKHHQTPSDTVKHHQTPSDTIRHHQTRQTPSDTIRHRQTPSDTIRHHQTPSNTVKHRQTPSDTIRHHQTPSDTVRHHQSPSDTIRHHQTPSDTIRHHQSPSDTIRHHQTPSNTIKHHQTPSDTISHHQTPSNTIKHHQTPSDTVKHHQTPSDTVRHHQSPSDTISHHQTPSDTIRHHQSPSDTIRHHQTPSNTIKHHQTPSDTISHHQTPSNTIKHHQTPSDTVKHHQTPSNTVRHHQTPSDTVKHHQTPSNTIRHRQTPSNTIRHRWSPSDTIRHHDQSYDNKLFYFLLHIKQFEHLMTSVCEGGRDFHKKLWITAVSLLTPCDSEAANKSRELTAADTSGPERKTCSTTLTPGLIMSAEDQLYEFIISWLDQRLDFSDGLRELAGELESVNEKCNAGRAVGNTTTVIGGLAVIGGGIATICSGGLAAPLLAVGGAYGAIGSTVTLTSKLIEWWLEKGTLKKAQKISEDNKKLGEKIQRRLTEMTKEIRKGPNLAVTDDYVIECILRAIAKRHKIPWMEVVGVAKIVLVPAILKLKEALQTAGVLGRSQGPGYLENFIREQAAGVVRQATLDTLKRVGKGALQVGGGVFTVALTLPDTIDNYKRAIKNNSVTGPSEELRKAADELKSSTQTFKAALKEIELTPGYTPIFTVQSKNIFKHIVEVSDVGETSENKEASCVEPQTALLPDLTPVSRHTEVEVSDVGETSENKEVSCVEPQTALLPDLTPVSRHTEEEQRVMMPVPQPPPSDTSLHLKLQSELQDGFKAWAERQHSVNVELFIADGQNRNANVTSGEPMKASHIFQHLCRQGTPVRTVLTNGITAEFLEEREV